MSTIPDLPCSRHARSRMQQRGIAPEAVDRVLRYGREVHDHHGAIVVMMDRAAHARLARDGRAAGCCASVPSRKFLAQSQRGSHRRPRKDDDHGALRDAGRSGYREYSQDRQQQSASWLARPCTRNFRDGTLDRLRGVYVVVALDGTIRTVGHRTRRLRAH